MPAGLSATPPPHLVNRPVAQQQDAVKDALDDVRGALEGFQRHDILLGDALQGRQGLVKGGLGGTQVLLSVVLHCTNLSCLLGHLLHDDRNLLLLCKSYDEHTCRRGFPLESSVPLSRCAHPWWAACITLHSCKQTAALSPFSAMAVDSLMLLSRASASLEAAANSWFLIASSAFILFTSSLASTIFCRPACCRCHNQAA